jgi:radical SAM superfamily enzyme YgiQ (UPF0313 family)
MRVAILELLHDRGPGGGPSDYFRQQFMSIMPQTIAVWCSEAGHDVHYRTYWGQEEPLKLVPNDVDILFVSSYTQSSAVAYAIATFFRRRGTLTVLGGPHARAFPTDCARFFDIVVQECDRALLDDILRGHVDPPAIVSSGRSPTEFPSVEERMPYIKIAAFRGGRRRAASAVPIMTSVGCPYDCAFCVDWNSKFISLDRDRLLADLRFLSERHPKLLILFHDPNFGIRFDETMDVIEQIPKGRRNRYVMEASLSVLKPERLPRLAETNCVYVAPGVESWTEFSGKTAAGNRTGRDKLEKVIAHFDLLGRYVPGLQANFIFGSDSEVGPDSLTLTKEFILRTPNVFPTVNIPTPYGGTPLYDQMRREGRILEATPFAFYYNPYLAIRLKHYDPLTYYDKLIEMHEAMASVGMMFRRLGSGTSRVIRIAHALRTIYTRLFMRDMRQIRDMLASDRSFRAYHEGRSPELPPFYNWLFERRLGRYAELVPAPKRRPVLDPPKAPAPVRSRSVAI